MPNFQYVQPTEEQNEVMKTFRDSFAALADLIESKVGESRGRSLSITKLEEAAFWLNKGITNNS